MTRNVEDGEQKIRSSTEQSWLPKFVNKPCYAYALFFFLGGLHPPAITFPESHSALSTAHSYHSRSFCVQLANFVVMFGISLVERARNSCSALWVSLLTSPKYEAGRVVKLLITQRLVLRRKGLCHLQPLPSKH